jgi:hypothetical protein
MLCVYRASAFATICNRSQLLLNELRFTVYLLDDMHRQGACQPQRDKKRPVRGLVILK